MGYFHAQWRRSNGTTALGADHVILDGVTGPGTYVGTYVALASLQRYWWGEGEVKFYVDDDDELPTLCSTGLEDYAGGAWAFQDELRSSPSRRSSPSARRTAATPTTPPATPPGPPTFATATTPMHGLYRWHLPDPIYFDERLRVTVQQIGTWDHGLFERQDDIATTAYWYQTLPHQPFPRLPDAQQRWPR